MVREQGKVPSHNWRPRETDSDWGEAEPDSVGPGAAPSASRVCLLIF